MSGWVFLLVELPLLAVWLLAIVDVVRRPDLRVARTVLWVAGMLLFFPVTLLYLLARPVGDVAARQRALDADDPRVRLVELVERSDRGEADAAELRTSLQARLGPAGRPDPARSS